MVRRAEKYTSQPWGRQFVLCAAACAALLLSGCTTVGFYAQAVGGHTKLLAGRQSVDKLLAKEQTPERLRARLLLTQDILRYAEAEMDLDVGRRYGKYVELGRSAVLWNVVAAPEFSLTPERWCFLVVGCVPYRGYFKRQRAERQIERLREQGLEVYSGGVAAYSTLGWFNDPLLSSFVHWPDGALAELLFHELSHSRVWIKGDVRFNESFASFVGYQGALNWLSERPEQRRAFVASRAAQLRFRALTGLLRNHLEQVYSSPITDAQKRERKEQAFAAFKQCYERAEGESRRYDHVIARMNNAYLALHNTYESFDAAFNVLFERQKRDWPLFFTEIERLGEMSVSERRQALRRLASSDKQVAQGRDDEHTEQVHCEALTGHVLHGQPAG